MKKYLYYSTIFSICTEALTYRFIIDLKLFYFIIFINTLILIFLKKEIFINKALIFFYSFLFITGVLSIIFKTNHLNTFFSQFLGIFFVSLYFYNFFIFFNNDIIKLIDDYVLLSFLLVVIGIPLFLYNLYKGNLSGFHSILIEPAHFVTFVLPSLFYSYKNYKYPRYYYKFFLISILASGSSLAIIGLAFVIFFSSLKIKLLRTFTSFFLIGFLFTALFFFYGNFNLRVTDTASGIKANDLTGLNLSSYALISNLFITEKSLSNNFILGSGLGSHEVTHDKYITNISGSEEYGELTNLNSKDANSLLLRVLSDLGFLGLTLVIFFIYKNYYRGNLDENIYLSRAILIYFLCKLIREGHYFPPEFYFFVFLFYFLNKNLFRYIDIRR